jgi:plasmid stabilization system protein ParE
MRTLVWSQKALGDLHRVLAFLDGVAPESTARAAAAIKEAVESLETFPDRYPTVGSGRLRKKMPVRFGRGGYIIHYVIDPDRIIIVRLWHSREARTTV